MQGPRHNHKQPESPDGHGADRARRPPEEGITEILERITEDFFAVDREWRYTYLNGRALRRIQSAKGESLTREELLGKSAWEVFPEQVGSVFYRKYHEALREQKSVAFEAYLPLTEEWYDVRAYPSASGLSVYSWDVTERRRTEKALEESHALLHSVVQQSTDAIFVKDTEDRYSLINSPGAEMMGMPVHEIVGKRTNELFPPDVASALLEADRWVIDTGQNLTYEERLPGMGVAETFLTTKVPYRDRQGNIIGVIGVARDITERKGAEEEIRRSKERFKAQYEGFPVPTISWHKVGDDFELVDFNLAADKLTQGKMTGLMGLMAREWYADDPQIMEALSRCHDERTTIYQEKSWLMRTTGEQKHLGVTFAYVPPDLVMTHAEDITERKRAEKALAESNALLRSIIEGTPDPIFLKDTRGRYLLANSAAAEVMGRSADELIGKDNADLMPPDVAERIMSVDRRVIENDEPHTGEERLVVRGVARTYLFTKAPYRNSQREVVGIIGVARDITEREQAEKELRHANERLHSLVRDSSDIITVLAADGSTRYQSPAIERVLGYAPEELIGKKVFDYVHPEDLERVLSKFDHLLSNAAANPLVEFRFRHKNGSWRTLEAIGSNLLHDPSIEGLVVNSRDTTERAKLHEDQQRFLTNAAHQLKTPITTIVGAAELLLTKQELGVAKKRQLLDHIYSEGRHMQRLSETLLRLARVGLDRRGPDLEPVDLAEVTRQAARRMAPLVERLGISLRTDGDGTCAIADPGWLQEVLLILLENAAKHSGPAREIRLRAIENTISVEDDGTGISSDELPHAFERFYRGKGSEEGFGLGLSIARELVERMGGSITLNSIEGSGTAVRIELLGAGTSA